MTPPDPAVVIDLIDAFRRSKAMFTATSLGVFEYLSEASASVAELAAKLSANADALERLLDGCVGLGLLAKRDGRYANSAISAAYLCRDSPNTFTGYVLYSDRILYQMWGNLEDAVREGTHRWKQTFQAEGSIFDHFFQNEESKRTFLMGMHGYGVLSSPRVVEAFDLSRFSRLVDLGGAGGHLAIAACEKYPQLRAAVFDLPVVMAFAKEKVAASSVADRIDCIAGDFFTDELPPADLYAVGRILHDWSQPKIERFLAEIHASLPAGGALLVAERLLLPDKSGPIIPQMQSLNMLICTEGKERTLDEYTALLHAAGFRKVEGRITGSPLDAVLALK